MLFLSEYYVATCLWSQFVVIIRHSSQLWSEKGFTRLFRPGSQMEKGIILIRCVDHNKSAADWLARWYER